jgi:hypothetical protein
MGHGREHPEHRQPAHVALAEIGLQSPDRDDDLPWHAEPRFHARQQRGVTLQHRASGIDAAWPDAGRNIMLERPVEGAALAAIETQHRWILLHAAERRADDAWRNAVSLRLSGNIRHEGIEVAAAAGGERRATDHQSAEQNRQTKIAHANPFITERPFSIMP